MTTNALQMLGNCASRSFTKETARRACMQWKLGIQHIVKPIAKMNSFHQPSMTRTEQATEALEMLVVTAMYVTAMKAMATEVMAQVVATIQVAAATQMVEVPAGGRSGRQSQKDKQEGSRGKMRRKKA
jgi:hypothetical protein